MAQRKHTAVLHIFLGFDSRQWLGDCTSRWQCWAVILHHHPTMLTVERLAMCSTRGGSEEMYIRSIFASAMQIRKIPLWIYNLKDTSPEIQNRGSGPKIGLVNVSAHKTFFNKAQKEMAVI